MSEMMKELALLLKEQGVEHAFGVTGSGNSWNLIDHLENNGIKYHPVAHEAAGALMAGAATRMTGKTAVSISIKGPGTTNMLPGIAANYLENIPSLSISEAYGTAAPSFKMHKRLDHRSLLSSIVKARITLDDVGASLPQAIELAQDEIPAPVHLDLCTAGESATPFESHVRKDSINSSKFEELSEIILSAKKPVLIAGSLAIRRGWSTRLDKLKIPVFTTAAGKGAVDESLDFSAGVFTGAGKELAPETHLLSEESDVDLVIGLGLRNLEILNPKPFKCKSVIVDETTGPVHDGFESEIILIEQGDSTVEKLFDSLEQKERDLDHLARLKENLKSDLVNDAWLPADCFYALNGLDWDYTMMLDTGSFCTIGEHLWHSSSKHPYLGSSNGRYLGVVFPYAVGAAIAANKPVICCIGDGGMRMYPQEMKLAVQEKAPVCVLHMIDGQYGSIACADPENKLKRKPVEIFSPSWKTAMESFGCPTKEIGSTGSLISTLNSWDKKSPLFLELKFDKDKYAVMANNLR